MKLVILCIPIYSHFLVQLIRRVVKISLSYISWQSNEKLITPYINILLYTGLFLLVLGMTL